MKTVVHRKIIHIDMDSFYASIEIRDNPYLKDKPVAIGSSGRGVLCTCNYEARKYGIHSAMPTYKALRKCDSLVLLPVNMSKYKEVSNQIRKIFANYSSAVEPLSLDEAFIDVTGSDMYHGSATLIAKAIRDEIYKKQQLTASAGISSNKLLAKIASDWNKPNGQFVIPPKKVTEFVASLDVKKLFGVGKVTLKKLKAMGVSSCYDLQQYKVEELIANFGSYGATLYNMSRGIDDRDVESDRKRKSFSFESTFENDLITIEQCQRELSKLFNKLDQRIGRSSNIRGCFVKVKFDDFSVTTAEKQASSLIEDNLRDLLIKAKSRKPKNKVRLIGSGVRLKTTEKSAQYSLGL